MNVKRLLNEKLIGHRFTGQKTSNSIRIIF